jgi:hypothetical protein
VDAASGEECEQNVFAEHDRSVRRIAGSSNIAHPHRNGRGFASFAELAVSQARPATPRVHVEPVVTVG